MEELTAQVEKLNMANRMNRILAVVGAVFCGAAALLFARGQALFAATLVAACLFVFFMAHQTNRQYTRSATSANLRYGLARELEDFAYRPAGGITEEEFRAWKLLPIAEGKQRLLCRNFFSGQKRGCTLAGSEVAFHYRTKAGGTAGYRFLSGTLLTAKSKRRQSAERGGWLLLSDEQVEELEVQEFLGENSYQHVRGGPAGWQLYSDQEGEAPEEFLRRLADLPASVSALRLTESGAAAYLNGRFYTGAHYPAARPTVQRLQENTLPERDELWGLFCWWLAPGRGV